MYLSVGKGLWSDLTWPRNTTEYVPTDLIQQSKATQQQGEPVYERNFEVKTLS